MKKVISVLCMMFTIVLLYGNVGFANNNSSIIFDSRRICPYSPTAPKSDRYRGIYNLPKPNYSCNIPGNLDSCVIQNKDIVMEKGWHVNNVGKYYCKGDGDIYRNGWYWIDGRNYRFDVNGYVYRSQWIKENDTGSWYFVDTDGGAVTGWQKIDNVWYYFNPEKGSLYGVMSRNTVMYINDFTFGSGYFAFNNEGAKIAGCWYGGHYYDANGKRVN